MGRGRLQGLFLAHARLNGQQYRPDQITLLGSSVVHIGLDLESLRSKEYEFRLEALALQAVELKQQLKHAEQLAAVQEGEATALRLLVLASGEGRCGELSGSGSRLGR